MAVSSWDETWALVANPHFELVCFPDKGNAGTGAVGVLGDVHQAFLKHAVQAHGGLVGGVLVGNRSLEHGLDSAGTLKIFA